MPDPTVIMPSRARRGRGATSAQSSARSDDVPSDVDDDDDDSIEAAEGTENADDGKKKAATGAEASAAADAPSESSSSDDDDSDRSVEPPPKKKKKASAAEAAKTKGKAKAPSKKEKKKKKEQQYQPAADAKLKLLLHIHAVLVPDHPKRKGAVTTKKAAPAMSNNDYHRFSSQDITTKSSWDEVKKEIDDVLIKKGTPVAEGDSRVPATGLYHVRTTSISNGRRATKSTTPLIDEITGADVMWAETIKNRSRTVKNVGADGSKDEDFSLEVDVCVICSRADESDGSPGDTRTVSTGNSGRSGGGSGRSAASGSTTKSRTKKIPTTVRIKLRRSISLDDGTNKSNKTDVVGSFDFDIKKFLDPFECQRPTRSSTGSGSGSGTVDSRDSRASGSGGAGDGSDMDGYGLDLNLSGLNDLGDLSDDPEAALHTPRTVDVLHLNYLKYEVIKACFEKAPVVYGDGTWSAIGKNSQLYTCHPGRTAGTQVMSGKGFLDFVRARAADPKACVVEDDVPKVEVEIGVGTIEDNDTKIVPNDLLAGYDASEDKYESVFGRSPEVTEVNAGKKKKAKDLSTQDSSLILKVHALLERMQEDSSSEVKDGMCFEHMNGLKSIYVEDPTKLPDGNSLPTIAVVHALLKENRDILRRCGGVLPMKGQYPRSSGTWLNVLTAKHPDGVTPNVDGAPSVGNGDGSGAPSASDLFFTAQAEKIQAEKEEMEKSTHAVHFVRAGVGSDQQFVMHQSIQKCTVKDLVRSSMGGNNGGVWSRAAAREGEVLWLECAEFKCRVIGDDAMDTPISNLLTNYSKDKQTLTITIYLGGDVEQVDNSDLLSML